MRKPHHGRGCVEYEEDVDEGQRGKGKVILKRKEERALDIQRSFIPKILFEEIFAIPIEGLSQLEINLFQKQGI